MILKMKSHCSLLIGLLFALSTACSKPAPTPREPRSEAAKSEGHADGDNHDADNHDKGKGAHSEGGEKHDEHEEGIVELAPEAFARANIRIAPAELREMPAELETTGEVGFNQDLVAHVSPRIPGRVHKVYASLGETVKAGQPLAVLDSIELGKAYSEYFQAKAEFDLAKQTVDREEKLLSEKVASEKDAQEARATFQKASAGFQAAEGQLRLYGLTRSQIQGSKPHAPEAALFSVSSPLGGVVTEKHLTLGELVNPENDMFTVADLSRLWIWIDLYERNLSQVHKEDDVSVWVETYPDRIFRGKVAYIGDQVNTGTRAVRARVDVENPERALKPGMFARVKLSDPHNPGGTAAGRKVLAIPASAVQRDGDHSVAFVQEGLRRFERRPLKLGGQSGDFVEVSEGLKAGEQVVTDGAFLLKSEAAKETMGEGHSH